MKKPRPKRPRAKIKRTNTNPALDTVDERLDEALKESFPSSDPIAVSPSPTDADAGKR